MTRFLFVVFSFWAMHALADAPCGGNHEPGCPTDTWFECDDGCGLGSDYRCYGTCGESGVIASGTCGFRREVGCRADNGWYSCRDGCGLGSDFKCYGTCPSAPSSGNATSTTSTTGCGGRRQAACHTGEGQYQCQSGCQLGSDHKCYGTCAAPSVDACPAGVRVAITFDHATVGVLDATLNAMAAGAPVTVFVDGRSEDIARQLFRRGAILGAHTDSHGQSRDRMGDVATNINMIREITGRAPTVASLPSGDAAYSAPFMAQGIRYVRGIHSGRPSNRNSPVLPISRTTTIPHSVDIALRYLEARTIDHQPVTFFSHALDPHSSAILDALLARANDDPYVTLVSYEKAMRCAGRP